MRKELKALAGQRMRFRGQVERFGKKTAYRGPDKDTLLLTNINRADSDAVVADHLWLTAGKQLKDLKLQVGDVIEFDARVDKYVKGYFGWRDDVYKPTEVDYRLTYPTKFKRV
ncbi:MAG: hypothetical protein L0154_21500 [Chloroflexi bacterium]|nr:hypothetical protein [Chloroflexota bacterium]